MQPVRYTLHKIHLSVGSLVPLSVTKEIKEDEMECTVYTPATRSRCPSVRPSDSSAVEAALEVEVQLQHASLEHGPEARLAVDVPLPVDDLGTERLGQVRSGHAKVEGWDNTTPAGYEWV